MKMKIDFFSINKNINRYKILKECHQKVLQNVNSKVEDDECKRQLFFYNPEDNDSVNIKKNLRELESNIKSSIEILKNVVLVFISGILISILASQNLINPFFKLIDEQFTFHISHLILVVNFILFLFLIIDFAKLYFANPFSVDSNSLENIKINRLYLVIIAITLIPFLAQLNIAFTYFEPRTQVGLMFVISYSSPFISFMLLYPIYKYVTLLNEISVIHNIKNSISKI